MKNKKQLMEERGVKLRRVQELTDTATTAKRELSAEENTEFDKLASEIEDLDKQIERAGKAESLRAAAALAGTGTQVHSQEEVQVRQRFSFIEACRAAENPSAMSGLVKEMHQEAAKEARALGIDSPKGVGIPAMVLRGGIDRRDNSVTMPTQPEDGAVLVDRDMRDMLPLLRDGLVTRQLGATVLTGLTGNLMFPKHTQGAQATFKQEVQELDKSNIKFGQAEMTPKRLGTFADVSKQLIIQSSYDVEALIRNEFINAINHAVDRAAIYGDGQDNEPLGLLNQAIAALVGGANGAEITWNHLVALEAMVEVKNAALGRMGYLLSNKIKGSLKTTRVDEGSGIMVLGQNSAELNGYPFVSSNLVKDATKGTRNDASAVVFGNWADLYIGQWGGLDILSDPYTLATKGQNRITINSFWDVMVRRLESFAAIKDAVPNIVIQQAAVNE